MNTVVCTIRGREVCEKFDGDISLERMLEYMQDLRYVYRGKLVLVGENSLGGNEYTFVDFKELPPPAQYMFLKYFKTEVTNRQELVELCEDAAYDDTPPPRSRTVVATARTTNTKKHENRGKDSRIDIRSLDFGDVQLEGTFLQHFPVFGNCPERYNQLVREEISVVNLLRNAMLGTVEHRQKELDETSVVQPLIGYYMEGLVGKLSLDPRVAGTNRVLVAMNAPDLAEAHAKLVPMEDRTDEDSERVASRLRASCSIGEQPPGDVTATGPFVHCCIYTDFFAVRVVVTVDDGVQETKYALQGGTDTREFVELMMLSLLPTHALAHLVASAPSLPMSEAFEQSEESDGEADNGGGERKEAMLVIDINSDSERAERAMARSAAKVWAARYGEVHLEAPLLARLPRLTWLERFEI